MSICKKFCFVLLISIFVGGCYEDVIEIKLNPDGSGSIKQRSVLSERLMTATESENESVTSNGPETTKEALVKKIGTAFNIVSIKQEDTPDGGRIIELEGKFDTPEQFFLSEYCIESLKLSISPSDEGKAAIYCDMSQSGDTGPDVTQMYGLAKGLLMKRTIKLPTKIEKNNGTFDPKANTVSWSTDLRNKEALAKTKAFVEGNDKGKGFVIFDSSELKFSLPLKSKDTPAEPEPAETDEIPVFNPDSSSIAAKVSWVSVKKKLPADGSGIPDLSSLQVGIDLTWDEDNAPFSCENPVLTNIKDDLGNNLVSDSTLSNALSKINSSEQKRMKKELTVKANSPNNNAKKLKKIEGYIETVIKIDKETIALENLQDLVGKPTTGIKTLDSLDFKIKSIEGKKIRIEIDGGSNSIVSIALFKDDGTEIKRSGSGSGQNNITYSFREDISHVNKCDLEVVVSEHKAKVPFSIDEIDLP